MDYEAVNPSIWTWYHFIYFLVECRVSLDKFVSYPIIIIPSYVRSFFSPLTIKTCWPYRGKGGNKWIHIVLVAGIESMTSQSFLIYRVLSYERCTSLCIWNICNGILAWCWFHKYLITCFTCIFHRCYTFHGCNLFVCACRNFPQGTISDMVSDASQGISFICNNIAEYGGDPNRWK